MWLDGDDQDRVLQLEPVVAQLSGPLQGGQGRFSLLHLPFSLLALFGPLPSTLRGGVGLTGRYRLDEREGPLVDAELALEQAAFAVWGRTMGWMVWAGLAVWAKLCGWAEQGGPVG